MLYALHITNRCNLRCVYCYEDNNVEEPGWQQFVMTPAEIDQKIAAILHCGDCTDLELIGGEVFLYPELVQYVFDKYHEYFPRMRIQTNGMCRNAAIDVLLDKYKPRVAVSLDDPQTVCRQRVGINFEQVLQNARDWRRLTEVSITATLNPLNLRRIKETFDFYGLEQGFRLVHFNLAEDWLNDYYWAIYHEEVLRLIETSDLEVLRWYEISPWKYHEICRKEFVFENTVKKVERYNQQEITLYKYIQAQYAGYVAYCRRLGEEPKPLVSDRVNVVPADKPYIIERLAV
jgi:MoaA/NifB/PqqE/SkfB family radical SAM enzyme